MSAPTNHYNSKSSPYHQSPTPPPFGSMQQPSGSSMQQQQQSMQQQQQQQQQPQQQHNNTFNQQCNQGGDVHHPLSVEYAAAKLRAVNPNSVAQFYEACQLNPHFSPLCIAINWAPDPTKAGKGAKKHSLNKPSRGDPRVYTSDDGSLQYMCNSVDDNHTLNYRPNTTKLSANYQTAFSDGNKLKTLFKHYHHDIWFDAKGFKYDLRKLFDPTGGVTIEYTPIRGGPTSTIGWTHMQGEEERLVKNNLDRRGNQLAVMLARRADILTFCVMSGRPLLVRDSFLCVLMFSFQTSLILRTLFFF